MRLAGGEILSMTSDFGTEGNRPVESRDGAATPLLSVVIPAYNIEDFVVAAVDSALAQTLADLEVIVVDDGSTDRTAERVAALADPRLRLIRQENRGLGGARNSGIRAARGRFVGLLDGDDIWYPEKAERHLAIMQADPEIGLTFSHSRYIDEDGQPTGGLLISKCISPSVEDLVRRNHVGNGSTPIIRRDAFQRAGLFNESLRSLHSAEDYEMWVRLLHASECRARLIPEALTGYRIRSSSLSMDFDRFHEAGRQAVGLMEGYIPDLPEAAKARGLADSARITSRKALSAGNLAVARRYLLKALGYSPSLVLRDWRALGTFLMILVQSLCPARLRPGVQRAGYATAAFAHRLSSGSPGRAEGQPDARP